MKKYLYIALAAAALTSCSQDETLDIQKEAIAFGDAFVDNSTRAATDPSYGTHKAIGQFSVWGTVNNTSGNPVSLYKGATVTNPNKDDNGNYLNTSYGTAWDCSTVQYWIYDVEYNFAAVVNGTVTDADLTSGLPTSISYTADGTSDLLYAEQLDYTRTANDNKGLVKFNFTHLLSKVKITAQNTTSYNENYAFTITDLSVNTPASGKVTIGHETDGKITSTWSNVTSGTRTFTFTTADKIPSVAEECDSEMLFIPYAYTGDDKLTITFKANWYYGNDLIKTEDMTASTNVTLLAGNSYSFNIKFGLNNPIQFTVETDPNWTENSSQDITAQ